MVEADVDIRSFTNTLKREFGGYNERQIISNDVPYTCNVYCFDAVPVRIVFDQARDRIGIGAVLARGQVRDLTLQSGVFRATASDLDAALEWVKSWAARQLSGEYVEQYLEFAPEYVRKNKESDRDAPRVDPGPVNYLPNKLPPITMALPLFRETFGSHGRIDSVNSRNNTVKAVLYEAFDISFSYIDPRWISFGCGIIATPHAVTYGFSPPLRPDGTMSYRTQIAVRFAGIDKWCRAVLPADYLAAMVEAYGPLRELPDLSVASDGTTDTEETPS